MKRLYSILILAFFFLQSVAVTRFEEETLNYKVMFKWGLVQKQAGRATLKLKSSPDAFVATLYARSESWADHFYSLRDTLISTMSKTDMLPSRYERIAHEGGRYARDIITINRAGNVFTGESVRYRRKKNDSHTTKSQITLSAEGPTVDLLSVFYYLRAIDFGRIKPGYTKTINIFSGKRKEYLKIKYHGIDVLELDGKKYQTYRISFTFTADGSKKSSDDIDTWIWTNSSHIPLKLEGKLKVGRIRCLYTGNV
ncbi:MAG: DUF3108 domain-containing protein [Paramuribaculum sp.]|nr:DUF3108 domain-containing protein [Paramuribaculum sp.]